MKLKGGGGVGVGVVGLGVWPKPQIPNPQSPIPNPQSPIPNPQLFFNFFLKYVVKFINYKII